MLAPYLGVEAAAEAMGRCEAKLETEQARDERDPAPAEQDSVAPTAKSSKAELLARVSAMSEEEAARARLEFEPKQQ